MRSSRHAAAMPGPVVLDRGIPDVIGYLRSAGRRRHPARGRALSLRRTDRHRAAPAGHIRAGCRAETVSGRGRGKLSRDGGCLWQARLRACPAAPRPDRGPHGVPPLAYFAAASGPARKTKRPGASLRPASGSAGAGAPVGVRIGCGPGRERAAPSPPIDLRTCRRRAGRRSDYSRAPDSPASPAGWHGCPYRCSCSRSNACRTGC